MTSLLPVCLALLLPACVLGQYPVQFAFLLPKCPGDAVPSFFECGKYSSPDSMTSESKCRDGLNEMMKCMGDLFYGCLPQEYHGLVLTDAMTTDMVSYLCQHMTELRSCWDETKVSDCRLLPNTTVDSVEGMCTYLHGILNCIKEGYPCNGSAASVSDAFLQRTIPPACGPKGTDVPLASTPLGTDIPLASTPFGTGDPLTSTPFGTSVPLTSIPFLIFAAYMLRLM